MIEFMVDLETMGIGPNAAIVAIGAVAMDTDKLVLTGDEFYGVVSLQSSVDAGLVIDPSTVLWWLGQSDEARKELYGRRSIPLYDALSNFSFWVAKNCPAKGMRCIWGNGASFDNVVLASAYKAVGRDQPWTYSGDRCYRTMRQLHPAIGGPEASGVAHNALADAKWQAEHLMLVLKGVRG